MASKSVSLNSSRYKLPNPNYIGMVRIIILLPMITAVSWLWDSSTLYLYIEKNI